MKISYIQKITYSDQSQAYIMMIQSFHPIDGELASAVKIQKKQFDQLKKIGAIVQPEHICTPINPGK